MAATRFTQGVLNQLADGKALYQQGEIHRLRGDLCWAEEAYQAASQSGCEPQPGLSLLRLVQGNTAGAAASIRRAVSEETQSLQRAALLPAYVEIMLAAGEVDAAGIGCGELEAIAQRHGSDALAAMSAHARGAVALAENDASSALGSRCAAPGKRGTSLRLRTRRHARACGWGWPVPRSETKTPPNWSSRLLAECSSSSERRSLLRASIRSPAAA